MNVHSYTKMQESSHDKIAGFWGVRRQSTGWLNNSTTSSDMHHSGWYYSSKQNHPGYWMVYWIAE